MSYGWRSGVSGPAKMRSALALLIMLPLTACAAATEMLGGATARPLESDFMAALSAERCALERPYLSPIYRMPWSQHLERSRHQAETVGLGPILAQAERKWRSERPGERNCPADSHTASSDFTQAVRKFDQSLDAAIVEVLARARAAPAGTSPLLVKAMVDAKWGFAFSHPVTCPASNETALATEEKSRFEALRAQARRQGRQRDMEAADRRWVAEKVKWDRDTATADVIVRCAANRLHAANDEVELVLAALRSISEPGRFDLRADLATAVAAEVCLLNNSDHPAEETELRERRRLDLLANLFRRWGWHDQLGPLGLRQAQAQWEDCDPDGAALDSLHQALDRMQAAALGY